MLSADFRPTPQTIAPDQPVMALAGVYKARGLTTTEGRDVADLLLRGQAILTPNAKTDGTGHEGGRSLVKMPEAKLLLSEFNAVTGEAFAGKEQTADLMMQAARAVYAARSAEEGDYSGTLDSKRWRAAVQLATGGVRDHNGRSLVMPYGMAYDVFQTRFAAQAPDLAARAVGADADELRRLPLDHFGDGRYLFRRGAGFVVDKEGRPLVVDMNQGPGAVSIGARSWANAPEVAAPPPAGPKSALDLLMQAGGRRQAGPSAVTPPRL